MSICAIGSVQVTLNVSPWLTFIAGITTIAAAAYALTAFQFTFWQARPAGAVTVRDLVHTEWLILAIPLGLLVLFGVYSTPALNLMQPAVRAVLSALGGN